MEKRFVAPLTDSDEQALISAYQHGERHALRRRAHAILLSHQSHTVNQISEILQVRRDVVSHWFQQSEASGLDGLIDKPRSGRTTPARTRSPASASPGGRAPLQVRTLQARFQEETGKSAAMVTLRRALKKSHSFKHIWHSLKAQRNETDFRNTQSLMKALHQQEDQGEHKLYCFDESGFAQSSSIPYAWSPMGKPREIPAYSHNRRLNVLGFLSHAGKLVYYTTTATATPERSRD